MIKHVNIFCSMFWMDKANNSMISTVPVMVTNKENAPSTDPAGRRCASVWWIVIGAFSEHTWSDCIFIGTLNTSCVCMYDFNWSYSFFHILFIDFTRNQCVFPCFPINPIDLTVSGAFPGWWRARGHQSSSISGALNQKNTLRLFDIYGIYGKWSMYRGFMLIYRSRKWWFSVATLNNQTVLLELFVIL